MLMNESVSSRYDQSEICAVIVAYNPDQLLLKNIGSLQNQVNSILVIDNGSRDREVLKTAESLDSVQMKHLPENEGIACALNKGLRHCQENGYALILTMDQDTILAPDAVACLLKCMNTSGAASVGINWDHQVTVDTETDYLITSGNLVNVKIAEEIGGYDESLFIDSVDFDFSIRLLDAGYRQVKAAAALAEHRLGETQGNSGYQTHSAERYYYIFRNHFFLIRKHWKRHRLFCLKKQLALMYDLSRILIFDQDRKEKFRMLKKGYQESKKL